MDSQRFGWRKIRRRWTVVRSCEMVLDRPAKLNTLIVPACERSLLVKARRTVSSLSVRWCNCNGTLCAGAGSHGSAESRVDVPRAQSKLQRVLL